MKQYNNLIIFDLDGVLIDSRDLHYYALNDALTKVGASPISYEEHLSTFDGLPTKKKLEFLIENNRVLLCDRDKIRNEKQTATLHHIRRSIKKSQFLIDLFFYIKNKNIKIAVASNAVPETIELALDCLGVLGYVDFIQGNNVKNPKPYPEIYWECMKNCFSIPSKTVIVEDSHIGRQGAIDSGAHLLPVENCNDVTFDKVKNIIEEVFVEEKRKIPWKDKNLNVLIPMAGAGSRFQAAGYTFPKPLIDVRGKPMIQVVFENLNIEANYIFIVQREHYETYHVQFLLNLIAPDCKIVLVDGLTEGAACTALLAKEYIDNDNPLLIANSDQWIDWNSNEVMYAFKNDNIDGGILTFEGTHPKWSYAKIGSDGFVSEVAEKKVISTNATVGVYYWQHGSDFVKYAEQMIAKNVRTNNEFYICPVYNEAIQDGKKIRVKNVERMQGLGTPEDLNNFLKGEKNVY